MRAGVSCAVPNEVESLDLSPSSPFLDDDPWLYLSAHFQYQRVQSRPLPWIAQPRLFPRLYQRGNTPSRRGGFWYTIGITPRAWQRARPCVDPTPLLGGTPLATCCACRAFPLLSSGAGAGRRCGENKSNDQAVEPESFCKDKDKNHPHEQLRLLTQRSSADVPHNTNCHTCSKAGSSGRAVLRFT